MEADLQTIGLSQVVIGVWCSITGSLISNFPLSSIGLGMMFAGLSLQISDMILKKSSKTNKTHSGGKK